jgi:DNA-binding NarL/FixJ family response regulator
VNRQDAALGNWATPGRSSKTTQPRILLVAYDSALREFIATLLRQLKVNVVSTVEDGQGALVELDRLQPDVIILDAVIPRPDGFEVLRRMRRGSDWRRAIIVSGCSREDYVFRALSEGAVAYIDVRDALDRWLPLAIEEAFPGEPVLSPRPMQSVFRQLEDLRKHYQQPDRLLSPREVEVLRCRVGGESPKETACSLYLSVKTVEKHLTSIRQKLRAKTDTDLIRYSIEIGLLTL